MPRQFDCWAQQYAPRRGSSIYVDNGSCGRFAAIQSGYMAETSKGKKFVKVHPYASKRKGKKVRVNAHDRSTPFTSTGKKSRSRGTKAG